MNKLLKLRKNKKGFTLVELLVVLVILAILAAAIIPSMLGFIDKAKEESASAECKSVLLAANVVINADYGSGATAVGTYKPNAAEIQKIGDLKNPPNVTVTVDPGTGHPKITGATYEASNGSYYAYNGTVWTKTTAPK